MTIELGSWLAGQTFAFMLIFCRVAAAMMLFPGVGEAFVLPRLRLLFSLALSFLLLAPLGPSIPAPPEAPAEAVRLILQEVTIGIFFGTILRIMLSTLETAGTIISFQIGLSNATLFNPAFASQGTLSGALLSAMAITILFVSGYDDMLLRSFVGTYGLMPVQNPFMTEDIAQLIMRVVSESFMIGAQLSAPFLIIGIVMTLVFGVMSKLMPQIQIFVIALPLQILAGLALFSVTASGIVLIWLGQFNDSLRAMSLM